MTKKILLLVILLFLSIPAFAQVDTSWVRRYNGPANSYKDRAYDIAVDDSGNVYVTGGSVGSGTGGDYATIKYDPQGTQLWVQRYNGPGNAWDEAFAIAVDGSGNVCVTGLSAGLSGDPWRYDYATIKYYPNGDIAWGIRYNGLGNNWDEARAIAVDGSGNVYVTGLSAALGTGYDYATIKYYPNGDVAWLRRYNGPANSEDYARAIAVDDSNNVYVTGYSYGSGTYQDYATIKYYANGDTAWVQRYNGPGNGYDVANAIVVDDYGNVYVTGKSDGGNYNYDYATIKYYTNGDTAWVRRYNGPGDDYDVAYAIALDGSGNVYVTGHNGWGSGYGDYATIKYYPNGDTAWVRGYSFGYQTEAYAIALDGSGNVYVTGVNADDDYATVKYDPQGNQLWVQIYNGPGYSTDRALAIAVDDSGNVYVTGESWGIGTNYDYATIKYWQNYAPNSFSLISPEDGAFLLSPVTFDWQDATDPDPLDTVSYDLYVSRSIVFHPDSTTIYSNLLTSQYSTAVGIGTYYWKVRAFDKYAEVWSNQTWTFLSFIRGNVNGDGVISLADVIYLANYVLKGGSTPIPLASGDVNCDGKYDLVDVIRLARYVLFGEPFPC